MYRYLLGYLTSLEDWSTGLPENISLDVYIDTLLYRPLLSKINLDVDNKISIKYNIGHETYTKRVPHVC